MTLYSAAAYPLVCAFDPAIDREACDVLRYVELRDMALLRMRPGAVPTTYHVARLETTQAIRIMRHGAGEEERNALAFAAGVVRVDQLTTRDGVAYPHWVPQWVETAGVGAKARQMTDEELNLHGYHAVQEIGSFALQRGFLAPGTPLYFAAPLSSADALARMAASSHRAAVQSNGTVPSEPG